MTTTTLEILKKRRAMRLLKKIEKIENFLEKLVIPIFLLGVLIFFWHSFYIAWFALIAIMSIIVVALSSIKMYHSN